MRIKKLTVLVLATIMIFGLSACNVGNDRDLRQGYNDGLPYTYDDESINRNGMTYNRFDNRDGLTRNGYNRYMDNNGLINDNNGLMGKNNRFMDNNGRFTNRTNANDDAERMADIAARVNGVDDATVIIAGRTAYVGIDIAEGVRATSSSKIERDVHKSLKRYARQYNLSITSDRGLFDRLRNIGDGIRNGTPLNRYQNDFRTFDTRLNNGFNRNY